MPIRPLPALSRPRATQNHATNVSNDPWGIPQPAFHPAWDDDVMTSSYRHESDRSMGYDSKYSKTPEDLQSVIAAWVVFLMMILGTALLVAAKALLG